MSDRKPQSDSRSDSVGAPEDGELQKRGELQIRQLVLEHYEAVYRYAYRLSGGQADAEDLTQQTFLIAQQKLHQVRDAEKVDRWLFAVLRSCFCKNRRINQRTHLVAGEIEVADIPDGTHDDDMVDRELLQSALSGLPEKFRLVLVMFYFDELSYKQIAAELDISIGTVMSRLSRAKGRLRNCLLAAHESPRQSISQQDASSFSAR